jgi:uncharacterized protein YdhG (YjbR/CyaY superfamily)
MREKKKFQTVDEYIKTFPEDVQIILENIRQTIREVAPEAAEAISYGIPTFKLKGRDLVYFAAWKNHIGFYPMPSAAKAFKKNCQGTSKEKVPSNSHWTNLFHMTWSKRLLFFELEKVCLLCNLLNP